jgi:hypothetical protein
MGANSPRENRVYLKRSRMGKGYQYALFESYEDQGCWKHRKLMDLGHDPEAFIEYPGGRGFYFKEIVEDTLLRMKATYSEAELENLFRPFIRPDIRRIIDHFDRGQPGDHAKWRVFSREEMLDRHLAIHPFDKRRLHYLRCGRVDIGNLDGTPWKMFNVLLEKSRDEIETLLNTMERDLPPHEIRTYLYTALDIRRHFRHSPGRDEPAALNPERVDDLFVEDLCRLNRDPVFFKGLGQKDPDSLHAYLRRYLILYFDNDFDRARPWGEYVRDFIGRHQSYRPPRGRGWKAIPEDEACKQLGITLSDFKKMSRRTLIRCYKRRAKETHPDGGGSQEAFIKVKEAYECLIVRK